MYGNVLQVTILSDVFFENHLNSQVYQLSYKLTIWSSGVSTIRFTSKYVFSTGRRGALPRFSAQVREHLNAIFPEKWIRGSINLPTRFPALAPPDFFFQGTSEDTGFQIEPTTTGNMKERTLQVFASSNNSRQADIVVRLFSRRIILFKGRRQHIRTSFSDRF